MKKLFLPLLVVMSLASCSKSELSGRPGSGDAVEIKMKSNALTIETKAPFEGTIGSPESLTAKVLVSESSADYTTTYASGNITFTDNGTTEAGFTPAAYYPVDNSTLYLCGLYPATDSWQNINTTTSFTFDGKDDIMVAAQQTSTKNEAQAGTYPVLGFKHLLTKLVVKVKAKENAAIAAWGNITDITLKQAGSQNPYNQVSVTLASGAAATGSAFSGNPGTMAFYTITDETTYNDTPFTGQTLALTEDFKAVAYSLVAPITASGTSDFVLEVKTANETKTVAVNLKDTGGVDAFTGDTQGKAFEINLTFSATEIQAKATVEPWEDAGKAEEEIK